MVKALVEEFNSDFNDANHNGSNSRDIYLLNAYITLYCIAVLDAEAHQPLCLNIYVHIWIYGFGVYIPETVMYVWHALLIGIVSTTYIGLLPIHLALSVGSLRIVKYFMEDSFFGMQRIKADLLDGRYGASLLHWASLNDGFVCMYGSHTISRFNKFY